MDRIFLQLKICKKRDILSEKQESGTTLKKLEFTPESGTAFSSPDGIYRGTVAKNRYLKVIGITHLPITFMDVPKPQRHHNLNLT